MLRFNGLYVCEVLMVLFARRFIGPCGVQGDGRALLLVFRTRTVSTVKRFPGYSGKQSARGGCV